MSPSAPIETQAIIGLDCDCLQLPRTSRALPRARGNPAAPRQDLNHTFHPASLNPPDRFQFARIQPGSIAEGAPIDFDAIHLKRYHRFVTMRTHVISAGTIVETGNSETAGLSHGQRNRAKIETKRLSNPKLNKPSLTGSAPPSCAASQTSGLLQRHRQWRRWVLPGEIARREGPPRFDTEAAGAAVSS